ncbi:MAG: hypothetical protein HGB19_10390 [Chlorobiales bacterium]|nr:hypothetical protein [Chlorobiales bacterium]
MVKNLLKAVAKKITTRRTGRGKAAFFETEITVPEKALNVLLEMGTKRDAEMQKPHIVVYNGYFKLKFYTQDALKQPVYYEIPLHVAELTLAGSRQVALLELAGKISIVPGKTRRLLVDKVKQGVCNSRYGRHKILQKVADSVEHLKYREGFYMCGNEVRPTSLQLEIGRLLRQHQTASMLLDLGLTNVIGITGLREEDGRFVLGVSVGRKKTDGDAYPPPSTRQRYLNVTQRT